MFHTNDTSQVRSVNSLGTSGELDGLGTSGEPDSLGTSGEPDGLGTSGVPDSLGTSGELHRHRKYSQVSSEEVG